MSDETNEVRQDNELTALQAIYGDAVIDNREAVAWKIWRPLDIMLTLHPLHNSDIQGVHCSVTLHFKCCVNYPDKPPKLAIHKIHGISTDNGNELLRELEQLATQLCGEVCIFQLAQHAQQFLHDHNTPTLSFYDQMIKEKTEEEQLKLHHLEVKENEERQKMEDEIQRRQEILRSAGRQRSHISSISQENDSLDGHGDAPELVYYADEKMSPVKKITRPLTFDVPCVCKTKGSQIIRINQRNNRKVYIGNCLGHSSNGSTTYLAIDDEGEPLITKKWVIPSACDFQTRHRQLSSIQTDLKIMSRLNHHTIVPYIAMEICKEATKKTTKQCIYLFRNFVLGTSLKYLKKKLFQFSEHYEGLKLLRHVGLGVLTGLKELHSVGLSHGDVTVEKVYLDDSGGVKLVGIDLDVTLAEMLDAESYSDRQSAAHDIYATGQMLLSILTKERTHFYIPQDLPSIAKDFFARCLTEDEHSQWTAEQLIKHSFLIDAPVKVIKSREKDEASSGSEDESINNIPQASLITNGHSRLNAEFEVLTWLGKGAFGDVLKVKNKLDGGFYAIKRVKLNPESVQLNKKITREVKLLSRLNHEHVVRYYNAWIESTIEQEEIDSSVASKTPDVKRPDDSLQGVIAKLGQEVKVEWSMSEGPVQQTNSTSDSEDSEEDDEQEPWFTITNPEDGSSSGIEFEEDSNQSQTIPSEDVVDAPVVVTRRERLQQVLYIQMEFCEKHTLRQAIDNGLYSESYRAWRLFREIVQGLSHVHKQGMIHRDLKPVNIFLDSYDHVKIGDFGLATKAFTTQLLDEKTKQEEIGGSLTGQIGTALYVAPELVQATAKVIYNQKVDLYSLGIILFEMFHPPLDTGMERMMVLTNLRSKEILLPAEFEKEENMNQIHVIRWLLNHDASYRPTCAELLSSEHVPRALPEGALAGLLHHALAQRPSRPYEHLVAACLDQRPSTAEDVTYNNDPTKHPSNPTPKPTPKPIALLNKLKDVVIKIFRSHGATEFAPPLLTPRVKRWDRNTTAVKVMTASGSVCHLPHDLRLPFARHTAYSKEIKYMRRYIVDRIYREKSYKGFHPKEIIECAFDIVTPKTDSLWCDAELLVVASRAATASNLKVTIQLNHTEMLKTLLVSCGVPLDKHVDIYQVLVKVSIGRLDSLQLQTHLTSLCVSKEDVSNLVHLMEADVSIHQLRDLVTPLVKPAKLSKALAQSITNLESLYRNAKALGCECPMTVAPFLAYNATQHSGIFWQMSVVRDGDNKRASKRRAGDIIAAGGRYDVLVEEFCRAAQTQKERTSSVGFSMSLERIAAILKKTERETLQPVKCAESPLICVCLWDVAGSGRDGLAAARRADVARAAWACGGACGVWPARPRHASDVSDATRARAVILDDGTAVRALCCDGPRLREYKIPYVDVIDFIKQQINSDSIRTSENTSNRSTSWSEGEKSNSCTTSVTFITAADRFTKNSKRHCENQINTQITAILVNLGLQSVLGRVRVNVLALSCEAACVRMLSGMLTVPLDHEELDRGFRAVCDAFPKRHSVLDDAHSELASSVKQSNQSRNSEEIQLYALYSIPDSLCRLIT